MGPLCILSKGWIKDEGDILNQTLKYGVDVDRRDVDDDTPFHPAIRWGQFKLVGILLAHKPSADVNLEINDGKTPFSILSESQNYDEAYFLHHLRLLLEHDLRPTLSDEDVKGMLFLGDWDLVRI